MSTVEVGGSSRRVTRARAKVDRAAADYAELGEKANRFFDTAGGDVITRLVNSGSCKDPVRACALQKGLCTEEWWHNRFDEHFRGKAAYPQLTWRENYRLWCQFGERSSWELRDYEWANNIVIEDTFGSLDSDKPIYSPFTPLSTLCIGNIGPAGHTIRELDLDVSNVKPTCFVMFEDDDSEIVDLEFYADLSGIYKHLEEYEELRRRRATIVTTLEYTLLSSEHAAICRTWEEDMEVHYVTWHRLLSDWANQTIKMDGNEWIRNEPGARLPPEVVHHMKAILGA